MFASPFATASGGFGASQPSPPSGTQPAVGGGAALQRPKQYLTPVTIASVMNAPRDAAGEFIINDTPSQQILTVCQVQTVEKSQACYTFIVADSTARSKVTMWYGTGDLNLVSTLDSIMQLTHVRIVGAVREDKGERYISAINIAPISDPNEIAFHLVLSIHTGLKALRAGGAKKRLDLGSTAFTAGVSAATAGGGGAGAVAPAKVVTKTLEELFQSFFKSHGEAGATCPDAVKFCEGQYSEAQVVERFDRLVEDGVLFSTIDDDHFTLLE